MPLDTVGGDLPIPLGGGVAVGVPPSDVDVLVDRTPFWLAITKDTPYQRETAQYQRDQVDQQPEAGEQSLAGWWTRSQMSFHYGAGLSYLDTAARPQAEDRLRFKTSRNVDCWTEGQVARLNATSLSRAASATERVWVEPTPTGGLIVARDSKVEVLEGGVWTTRNFGSSFSIRGFCTDGANYYVATLDGVWSAPIAGTATATKLWALPSTDVPMCLGWVKQRLMLGHGGKVYVLDGTGPTLPTAKTTINTAGWTWTSFCDSPTGILATGYAGLTSTIYKYEETNVADTPTITAGVVLLTMPLGERIYSSLCYLSSMLVVGTSRGIRVCPFNSYYGTMNLGPLSMDARHLDGPVTALGGYDRYIFGGTQVNGETSLVRLDLSAPLDDQGHYAWAPDLVFPTGTWTEAPTSIAFDAAGLKLIGVTGRGLVVEGPEPDAAEPSWLQTARIRMGTVEPKYWVYATVRGGYSNAAPLGVSVAGPGDETFRSVYVATTSAERFSLSTPPGEWIALRFDLSETAQLSSYQVQALPAGKRQRMIQLPVHIADYQVTRSGVTVGYPGWALDRLGEVEHVEQQGTEITVTAPALFPEAVLGVIEKLTYLQTSDGGELGYGTGGILQITLRTTE